MPQQPTAHFPHRHLNLLAGGSAVVALGLLAGCTQLQEDVVLGNLEQQTGLRSTTHLGHFADTTNYLVVCAGTPRSDVRSQLTNGLLDKYPTEGFAQRDAILLFNNLSGVVDIYKYDPHQVSLCGKSTTWALQEISTPISFERASESEPWVAQPPLPESTSAVATATDALLPSQLVPAEPSPAELPPPPSDAPELESAPDAAQAGSLQENSQ